jgi:hypothetical protein
MQVLAHEIGHATNPVEDVPARGLSKEEYMRRKVENYLHTEGAGAYEGARARQEGNPDRRARHRGSRRLNSRRWRHSTRQLDGEDASLTG